MTSSNPAIGNPYIYSTVASTASAGNSSGMPNILNRVGGWSITYKDMSEVNIPEPPSGPVTIVINNVGPEAVDALAADDSGVYVVIEKPFDYFFYSYWSGNAWGWASHGNIYHGYTVKKYNHSGGLLWSVDYAGNSNGVNVLQGPFINQIAVNKEGLYLVGYQDATIMSEGGGGHTPLPRTALIQKISLSGQIQWTKYPESPNYYSHYDVVDATENLP